MKKLLIGLIAIAIGMFLVLPTPVFADCAGAPTSIINCDENKDGIDYVLGLVIEIMTIGIGILGVIGITVVGIQYLTAGGSEEKTRKAKRRLFEIIIGLVVYAVFYAILNFLGVGK